MRILHVNKFVYRRGGAEAYMLDLATLQRNRGDEVEFFGMTHPENDPARYAAAFPSQVEFEPVPRGSWQKARAASRMLWSSASRRGIQEVISDFRPDVVHLHNIYHQLSPSVITPPRAAGIPTVMTLHDYKLICPSYRLLDHGEVCEACLAGGFRQAVRRRCKDDSLSASAILALETGMHRKFKAYDPVDVFVSPSRFLARRLLAAGVFPGRVTVVPHPVDAAAVPVKPQPGGPLVFAGRLSDEKGLDVLLRALPRVHPSVCLDVAGDGPDCARYRSMASELAPGRVRFHGRLGKAELLTLMREASAVVVPSRWFENQPLIVLEAFACAVPVVCSNLGGLAELVESGVEGLLVPPGDPVALASALEHLTSDPGHAFEMGRAGRTKAVSSFDPEQHVAALDDVYSTAARKLSQRRPAA